MNKLSRNEVIKLLKNKDSKTFKELSIVTGYHEKSLNRIDKEIKEGKYKEFHGNKGKTPHNKISSKEKEKLVKMWKKGTYSTKKEFYEFLSAKGYFYSYSFLAKLIIKEKKLKLLVDKPKILVIPRKIILENIIQYRNKRYLIKSDTPISHHECVTLFVYKETMEPLYIEYKNKKYSLLYQKQVYSRKGNTKY